MVFEHRASRLGNVRVVPPGVFVRVSLSRRYWPGNSCDPVRSNSDMTGSILLVRKGKQSSPWIKVAGLFRPSVDICLFGRGTNTSKQELKQGSSPSLYLAEKKESLSSGKGDVMVMVLSPAES